MTIREMIKDLEEMVYNHLCVFEKNSKAKPEKILMYRVSFATLSIPLSA